MDDYDHASYKASRVITNTYSTSFGLSIKLFDVPLRKHIYAIYGLVRIADEIVDTYTGSDKKELLDELEAETKRALETGYSTNPIVHAFIQTAHTHDIDTSLIAPFFESMRMDLTQQTYDQHLYETYIYGSAEVVGLMCLKVFTDPTEYEKLEPAAKRLGAAYQKVNFLRDIAADAESLGRWYFPISSAETFDERAKRSIIKDIEKDFKAAKKGIDNLPKSSQKAVALSYTYYSKLLEKIKQTPAETLLEKRIRVSDIEKASLFMKIALRNRRA